MSTGPASGPPAWAPALVVGLSLVGVPGVALLLDQLLPPPGGSVDPEVAAIYASCEALDREARDACVMSALLGAGTEAASGAQLEPVCRSIRDARTRDQCIEHAMTLYPLPPASLCEEVGDERMRDSCRLSVANQVVTHGTIDEAIAACTTTGPLVEHCLSHIAEYRQGRWRRQGPQVYLSELKRVIDEVEGATESPNFGSSVGGSAHFFGYTVGDPAGPCGLFPPGSTGSQLCADRHARNVQSGMPSMGFSVQPQGGQPGGSQGAPSGPPPGPPPGPR